jgi:hypothetical protein
MAIEGYRLLAAFGKIRVDDSAVRAGTASGIAAAIMSRDARAMDERQPRRHADARVTPMSTIMPASARMPRP